MTEWGRSRTQAKTGLEWATRRLKIGSQNPHPNVAKSATLRMGHPGAGVKTALRRIKNSGVICCARYSGTKMEILVKIRISYEAQEQAHDCDSHGSARHPRRRGRLRAG